MKRKTATRPSAQGSLSEAAVMRATGKPLSRWFTLLDRAGARAKSHPEIVRLLDEQGVKAWWCQMVTVQYERARGLRDLHQTPDGYRVTVSRTLDVPAAKAFQAWENARARARWLADPGVTVRKATPAKSLRITWVDGATHVNVNLVIKSPTRCQLAVEHRKLSGPRDVARMRAYWARALDRLRTLLES
jgi:uncharacterized protein YndB with AHSA1/START domain